MVIYRQQLKNTIQVLFSESWSKQSSVQQHTLAAARQSIIYHGEKSCEVQQWMFNDVLIKHKHLERRYGKHHIRKGYTHITAIQTICPKIMQLKWTSCHWTAEQRILVKHILFCDEPPFMWGVISTCHNSHVWSPNNAQHSIANNFQCCFSVNMRRGLTDYQLIKPHVCSQATLTF